MTGRGQTTGAARLLLVEDDRELGGMLAEVLQQEGYHVDVAGDGQRGLHLGLTRQYDVLVIDRRLPVLDGLDLLGRLRSRAVRTPALVLTAMGTVHDRVDGLDAGADDYLVKPFLLEELSARLRALRRRAGDAADTLPIGSARLLVGHRVVELPDGEKIALAAREFLLLWVLAAHPGIVYSRAELRRTVFEEAPALSIVDTYVYYLRRKLGRRVVRTVRGFGYQLGTLGER
ncbi:Transcriptional regulatory protein TcrA [Streptomyces sp. RB5]|uniref:Transcriptional regulatory protein TcrA n=1 Tax=Streptomyces smaragdinus TaxID=2585196 RepID=A0A7K0CCD6_9ACTN|nr:response regulator transcription factor [Streptomyces smaragdinus]MQY11099.1 Transcriptional regulatory protein TcrA [Streptomyces smaragdinus]